MRLFVLLQCTDGHEVLATKLAPQVTSVALHVLAQFVAAEEMARTDEAAEEVSGVDPAVALQDVVVDRLELALVAGIHPRLQAVRIRP